MINIYTISSKVDFFKIEKLGFLFVVFIFTHSTMFANQKIEKNQMQIYNQICNKKSTAKSYEFYNNLKNPNTTKQFYEKYCQGRKDFFWLNNDLTLNSNGIELLKELDESKYHGLNPKIYGLEEISSLKFLLENKSLYLQDELNKNGTRLDILLTNGYLSLAIDLYYGTTNWEKFIQKNSNENNINRKIKQNLDLIDEKLISWDRGVKGSFSVTSYLKDALSNKKIKDSLVSIYPKYETYFKLIDKMKTYYQISKNGGWGELNITGDIEINSTNENIPMIKKRLQYEDELFVLKNLDNLVYNEEDFIGAIKSYQLRHNQKDSGVITKDTIAAFNISVEAKILKIGLNMERFRWMSRNSTQDETKIVVNIPSLSMKLIDKKDDILSMKVIVGQAKRATPIFSEKIKYIVLNPTWTVPPSVISKDIFSQKGDQLEYFKEHDMDVFVTNRGKQIKIDPSLVEWNSFKSDDTSPFVFIAKPGKKNPLGGMKFIFPNKYSVYMHDTDRRDLFTKHKRTFSSGCIRLSEPEKLLNYLLEKDKKSIKNILSKRKDTKIQTEQTINLKSNIPVFVRYFTVTVDRENKLYFYDDIYGYDAHQLEVSR
jgi:L,D-transpeptidase YcbB